MECLVENIVLSFDVYVGLAFVGFRLALRIGEAGG